MGVVTSLVGGAGLEVTGLTGGGVGLVGVVTGLVGGAGVGLTGGVATNLVGGAEVGLTGGVGTGLVGGAEAGLTGAGFVVTGGSWVTWPLCDGLCLNPPITRAGLPAPGGAGADLLGPVGFGLAWLLTNIGVGSSKESSVNESSSCTGAVPLAAGGGRALLLGV